MKERAAYYPEELAKGAMKPVVDSTKVLSVAGRKSLKVLFRKKDENHGEGVGRYLTLQLAKRIGGPRGYYIANQIMS